MVKLFCRIFHSKHFQTLGWTRGGNLRHVHCTKCNHENWEARDEGWAGTR